jgi:hypothetical protein
MSSCVRLVLYLEKLMGIHGGVDCGVVGGD